MREEPRVHWSRAKSQQTQAINTNDAETGIKSGTTRSLRLQGSIPKPKHSKGSRY